MAVLFEFVQALEWSAGPPRFSMDVSS